VDEVLKEVCLKIEKRYQMRFLEIGTDKDHVFFLVQSVPTYRVTNLEHFSFFRSRLHRQAFASLARAMILAKEAGGGGMPMARTARAAFTKSSPVPVCLQYFEKCSSNDD